MDVQATQRIVSPDYFAAMRLRLVGRADVVRGGHDDDAAGDRGQSDVRAPVSRRSRRRLPHSAARTARRRIQVRRPERRSGKWSGSSTTCGRTASRRRCSRRSSRRSGSCCLGALRNVDPILVVRTAADPAGYVTALRSLVHEQAPALALDSVMTMEDRVMTSLAKPRLYAVVLAWFGACRAADRRRRPVRRAVVQRRAAHAAKSACALRSARSLATSSRWCCVRCSGLSASAWPRIGGGAGRRPIAVGVPVWHQPARCADVRGGTNRDCCGRRRRVPRPGAARGQGGSAHRPAHLVSAFSGARDVSRLIDAETYGTP